MRGEQQRRGASRATRESVQGEERERQVLHVQRLEVAEAHQRVRVEGVGQPGDDAGGALAGPSRHQPRHREAAQGEAGHDEQVVDEHRVEPRPR